MSPSPQQADDYRPTGKIGIWPEQLTFGSTVRSVEPLLLSEPGRIILKRRSSRLYEWESQHSRIRVERVSEGRWQGTMVVQRCNFPMSSLCSDPQVAADTLHAGFLRFYNAMKDIRLRNRTDP